MAAILAAAILTGWDTARPAPRRPSRGPGARHSMPQPFINAIKRRPPLLRWFELTAAAAH
jgi:hypothetical protein